MNTISIDDYTLFKPIELAKGLTLQNRVVYRPCTRGRGDLKTRIPTEHVAKYYEARASAGLIVTEGLGISEQGYGWYGTPALYTKEQAEGWRRVVDGVHARGGKIFAQLWHMGRLSHSSFHEGRQVASCSAGCYESGRTHHGVTGEPVPYETSRSMTLDEIKRVIEDYQHSAELAKLAGFDGVEVQCGGGYLIDEFLQSTSNKRTDEYGGSFENRFRLLREVIAAITSVFPANRVGILVSPNFKFGGLGSPDNFDMFSFVIRELSKLDLAYLVTQDGMGPEFQHSWRKFTLVEIKTLFQGTVVTTGNHSRDTGEGALRTGAADLVGYVRPFMVNPDLVERFLHDWPLNDPLAYEFYWDPKKGVEGYLDFKAYDPAQDDKATTQNTQ